MYYVIQKNKETKFCIEYIRPLRKKPCLCIVTGNEHYKVASFNNEEAAELFVEKMKEFLQD